jgi:predicted small lipoprotein YifL
MAATSGEQPVIRNMWRLIGKPAFLLAVIMVVGLSACGRRGPLEPPPNANIVHGETEQGTNGAEQAPREKRSFFLDFLL